MYRAENAEKPIAARLPARPAMSVAPGLVCLTIVLWLTVCAPLLAHDDPDEQIDRISAEIEFYSGNAELYMTRGGLHRMAGHWEAALTDFNRVAALDSGYPGIDFQRGRILFEGGEFQQARELLDYFLADHPTHVQALIVRAGCLLALGQPQQAAQDYSQAIAQMANPTPVIFLERADALAAAGDDHLVAAIVSLDEGAARLGPLILLQSRAVEFEIRAQRYAAALARIDQILAQSPRKETWLARRGEVLQQAGFEAEARASFAQALAAIDALPSRRRQTPALVELTARLNRYLERDP